MDERSALDAALSRVGDRWALQIVNAVIGGAERFNEIQASVDGIATNVLSQRLRHLEAAGVVVARPYTHRPVRYRYELTGSGRELAGVVRLLAQWGSSAEGAAPPAVHPVCGTPMEVRWWCPTCDRRVDGDEGDQPIRM